jgi:hypothetical protein
LGRQQLYRTNEEERRGGEKTILVFVIGTSEVWEEGLKGQWGDKVLRIPMRKEGLFFCKTEKAKSSIGIICKTLNVSFAPRLTVRNEGRK